MRVRAFLNDVVALDAAFARHALGAEALEGLFGRARWLSDAIERDPTAGRPILRRVDLHDNRLDIPIDIATLMPAKHDADPAAAGEEAGNGPHLHHLSMPVARLRRSREVRLLISEPGNVSPTTVDPALVRLIATAYAARAAMQTAGDLLAVDVAKAQGFTDKYFTLLLRLATLDPGIVQAILEGRQPPSLTRMKLAKITNLPIDWAGQRSALGFA